MWMMETERLCVRPFAAEDLEALHSILSDEEVMRWLEAPYSRKQTETFLAHVRGAEPPPVFAVTWKETGRVIARPARRFWRLPFWPALSLLLGSLLVLKCAGLL